MFGSSLREWIRPRSLLSWYGQVGIAGGLLLILFGMQPHPSSSDDPARTADRSIHASMDARVLSSLVDDGEQIYNTRCVSCHQMNGQGVPGTFPPLTDTDWVNGDKGRLIRLLLSGLSGSIEVKGQTYSGVMPPWGGALDDEEMAAITTYIRSNFGNDASPVTAEDVAKVREATSSRKKPWTAKELRKDANQGIPGDSTARE
jgi:mono/diheme cytochrome c family protein